jgi:hypothetical protein
MSEDAITILTINTLKYLNAVISEVYGLFPAGPETTRRLTNPGGKCDLWRVDAGWCMFLPLGRRALEASVERCDLLHPGALVWWKAI